VLQTSLEVIVPQHSSSTDMQTARRNLHDPLLIETQFSPFRKRVSVQPSSPCSDDSEIGREGSQITPYDQADDSDSDERFPDSEHDDDETILQDIDLDSKWVGEPADLVHACCCAVEAAAKKISVPAAVAAKTARSACTRQVEARSAAALADADACWAREYTEQQTTVPQSAASALQEIWTAWDSVRAALATTHSSGWLCAHALLHLVALQKSGLRASQLAAAAAVDAAHAEALRKEQQRRRRLESKALLSEALTAKADSAGSDALGLATQLSSVQAQLRQLQARNAGLVEQLRLLRADNDRAVQAEADAVRAMRAQRAASSSDDASSRTSSGNSSSSTAAHTVNSNDAATAALQAKLTALERRAEEQEAELLQLRHSHNVHKTEAAAAQSPFKGQRSHDSSDSSANNNTSSSVSKSELLEAPSKSSTAASAAASAARTALSADQRMVAALREVLAEEQAAVSTLAAELRAERSRCLRLEQQAKAALDDAKHFVAQSTSNIAAAAAAAPSGLTFTLGQLLLACAVCCVAAALSLSFTVAGVQ
jgi:trimeric autotransporter adhesin